MDRVCVYFARAVFFQSFEFLPDLWSFGSVPHSLIMNSLKRNHIPHKICQYFENCYRNVDGVVLTVKWRSKRFKFKRGVFQGDPLIPTLFLMNFNPILQLLKNMEKQGCLITLPYVDYFCVMTTDKRKQHKYTNLVNDKITSMGMKLKPSK